jgi:hypothetical protein
MKWTERRPTEGGFYYWQNDELRAHSSDAVRVVQVSKYKNREGFHCETLVTEGSWGPRFSCDLGNEPAGWWAGPLPQPYWPSR